MNATKVVFRYKLWLRLLFLFLFMGLLAVMGWMGSVTVQMVSWLSEPYMMASIIQSVLMSLIVLLALVLFGYTVLFSWMYRLELEESHLQTWMIYYPFLHPFRCAYDDVLQVRRGMMRGLLEIVPREGKSLRVAARAIDGGEDRLLDELSRRVGAECIEPNIRIRLWDYTRFDRLRLVFAVVILASQLGLLGLFVAHYAIPVLRLPYRLPVWMWHATGIEVRLILLVCSAVGAGMYAVVYLWQRRAWRSVSIYHR